MAGTSSWRPITNAGRPSAATRTANGARRAFASKSTPTGDRAPLECVPFRVSFEAAERRFHEWMGQHTPFWRQRSVDVRAVYLPFYSYPGVTATSPQPPPHGTSVRLSGDGNPNHNGTAAFAQVYAGHGYRREMVDAAAKVGLGGNRDSTATIAEPFVAARHLSVPGTLLRNCDVDVDECALECWKHGSLFDLETGEALTLPAIMPVAVHAVSLEAGEVFVTLAGSATSTEGPGA